MIRQGKELREAGLLEEDEKVSSLFEDEEQIKPLAGEAYMKEITQEEVEVIEGELSRLAETILKDWRRRQKQSKLEQVAGEVLGLEESIFEESIFEEEMDASRGTNSRMMTKLTEPKGQV